ncbi:hypothetical protein [Halotia branconii]|uniref:Uncharacterized protein n=1 Tax=Halotia branconii CENA392 TaxID=1539056 RepID=A0AAJ6NNG5_9CYAN|nr:hypothetical protein [Halotia branconii]WGV23672.1 hypothetical protein QI031_17865 [Halotia branconii CENA392]
MSQKQAIALDLATEAKDEVCALEGLRMEIQEYLLIRNIKSIILYRDKLRVNEQQNIFAVKYY